MSTKLEKSFRKNGKRLPSTAGIPLPRNKAKTGESKANKQIQKKLYFPVMWTVTYNFNMKFNLIVIC
jgi:hypothetical protein